MYTVHCTLKSVQNTENLHQRCIIKSSKAVHVLKTTTIRDKLTFKKEILADMKNSVSNNAALPLDLSLYKRKPVPNTFHGVEKPDKQSLVDMKLSRMDKN